MRLKHQKIKKIIADTISVPLSKKELELLIDKLSEMPITNKQALNIYQKLTKKNLKLQRTKMTEEQMQVSKEELEKRKRNKQNQQCKSQRKSTKKEQTKLEMQSPQYIDAKIPEEMKIPVRFENEIKDFSDSLIGYSQECEGTFKIKDGNVTDINIT